ncbi:MAG: hypothetical protein KGJ55_01925 [Gammaproteobacteria bacterium]|nr:hypothetical protein [Gammaproteobacteria bacterium]
MDFDAGLPILVASLVAVLLLSWSTLQRRWLESSACLYARRAAPGVIGPVIGPLQRTNAWLRTVALSSTFAAPTVMAFSGQLDAHGIANVYHGLLQIIAPLTSACFSAAVAWLLIVTPLAVHATHCRLLELFRASFQRREYW